METLEINCVEVDRTIMIKSVAINRCKEDCTNCKYLTLREDNCNRPCRYECTKYNHTVFKAEFKHNKYFPEKVTK